MRTTSGAITSLLLLFLVLGSHRAAAESRATLTDLDVLLVSPSPTVGVWIKTLLETHGATVAAATWEQAGVERAKGFDLVVVSGTARRPRGPEVKGYTVPVLGVGSAGLAYFGSMRLKHGSPFS